jgi:NADH oxidase (H2O2-forming)
MARRVIVIGANASGVEAASAARKKDRTAEITLITQEKNAGYSRCGLPFVIGGHIANFHNLIVYPPAYFQMLKLNLRNRNPALRQPRHCHRRRLLYAAH